MSRYVTGPQEAYLYAEYAATRPEQDQQHSGFAQPSLAWPYPDAQRQPSHAPAMPYIPTSQYQPRDASYQIPYPTFNDAQSHPFLQVLNFHPKKGAHGDKLTLFILLKLESTLSPLPIFSILFHGKRCTMAVSKNNREAPYYDYLLQTDVPAWETLGCLDSQVPLFLEMQDEHGQSLGTVPVGHFTYADMAGSEPYPAASLARKRKLSPEPGTYNSSPTAPERYIAQPFSRRRKLSTQPEPYASVQERSSTQIWQAKNRSLSTAATLDGLHPNSPPTSLASLPASFYADELIVSPQQPAAFPHRLDESSAYSMLPDVKITGAAGNIQASPASQYDQYNDPSIASDNHRLSNSVPRQVAPSPARSANPTFVRTSTMQSGQTTATPISAGAPFNPYAILPTKALLKLDGDLNSMAENWEDWECKEGRRLVQFSRNHEGSTITASFRPVTQKERGLAPTDPCISCIWWENKKECYVTSVDTIGLLESLVGARFTVEEKNRIRRNLEGFRPLTVSKAKSDSEDFFKLIMGFAAPKPRNIEKDVKVFPWSVLAHALKKIINKYSASYSSTAGPLLTPMNSGYVSGGISEAGTELHHTTSPRSASSSAASIAYPSGMTSTTLSPNIKASAGSSSSLVPTGPSTMQFSVPQHAAAAQGLDQWQAMPSSLPSQPFMPEYGATRRTSMEWTGYYANPSLARGTSTATSQSVVVSADHHAQQAAASGGDYKPSRYSHRTS